MNKTFLCALFLLWGIGSVARTAEPLRWNLEQGQELRYSVEHHNVLAVTADRAGEFSSDTRQTVDLLWRVEDSAEDVIAIQQSVEAYKLKITMPGEMELAFDSRTGRPAEGIAAMLSPMFDVLTKHPVRLKVDSRGKLVDLQADEEALEKLKTLPAIKPLGELTATEGLRQLAESVAFPLPEGELQEGVTTERPISVENRILGKMTGVISWRFTGTVERDGAEYERFEPSLKLELTPVAPPKDGESPTGPKPLADAELVEPKGTGEALFDRQSGTLHSLTLKVEATIKGKLAGHPAACDLLQQVDVARRQ